MRVVLFVHSLVSDWNHGNAHFLRGIASELQARGHEVDVYEPGDGWSLRHLIEGHGAAPARAFRRAFPELHTRLYDPASLDLDRALDGASLVLVHEWNDPELVRRIGLRRRRGGFRLFFHDTHHRAVTDPGTLAVHDLRDYDGVLAFGEVLADVYRRRGAVARAWTWHEAADVRRFRPRRGHTEGELVWIGNWGDDERSEELFEFLLEPCRALGLRGRAHGVRFPTRALRALRRHGLEPSGWLPNAQVPDVFARHRVTVHVPRRVYRQRLPGIPTIRVFEALACGIPLVSVAWEDSEGLFRPGDDYLVAHDGAEMRRHLEALLRDPERARALAQNGRRRIETRHTCAHRVDELLAIHDETSGAARTRAGLPATASRGD